jgi:hypothetical protein
VSFTEAQDVLATLAWMFPALMVKPLDAAFAAEQDDDAALSHEAKELQAAQEGDLLSVAQDRQFGVVRARSGITSIVWRHQRACDIGCTTRDAPGRPSTWIEPRARELRSCWTGTAMTREVQPGSACLTTLPGMPRQSSWLGMEHD